MRTRMSAVPIILSLVLYLGCRERETGPPVNRNLGTAQAPLLPPQLSYTDPDIFKGPRVQPIELPEFDKDMPTLADIQDGRADPVVESAGAEQPAAEVTSDDESDDADSEDADEYPVDDSDPEEDRDAEDE